MRPDSFVDSGAVLIVYLLTYFLTSLLIYFVKSPAWGRGTPFPSIFSIFHSLPHLLLFYTFSPFPFFIMFTYVLVLSIPALYTYLYFTF